jgi:ribosomal protein L14E/L6E/L27E
MTMKKNLWTNSAIQKVELSNKKLFGLFKFTKKIFFSKNFPSSNKIINSMKKKNKKILNPGATENKKNNKFNIGSIIILLGSKLKGKKSILLKKTREGLFVISGPFCINGISLRRIHPRFVLPTEIKIELNNFNLHFLNDDYFKFLKKTNKEISDFERLKLISLHRVRQAVLDKKLKKEIEKNFFLKNYLKTRAKIH